MSDVVTVIDLLLPNLVIRRFFSIAFATGTLVLVSLVSVPIAATAQETPRFDAALNTSATPVDGSINPAVTAPEASNLVLSAVLQTTAESSAFGRDDTSGRPAIALANAPVHGIIECRHDDGSPLPDDHWSGCSIVITSVADRRLTERATLVRADQPEPDSPNAIALESANTDQSVGRWEFHLADTLPEGVYELRLDTHTPPTSRWRGLLHLDRNLLKDRGDTTASMLTPETWPLIVLPSETTTATEIASSTDQETSPPRGTTTPRKCLVRWSGFPEIDAESDTSDPGTTVTSRFSWVLSGAAPTGSTPSQRWASIMNSIEQRLDTVVASAADGIVFDEASSTASADEKERRELLTRCVRAKANRLGLELWQTTTRTNDPRSSEPTSAVEGDSSDEATPEENANATLVRITPRTGPTTASPRLSVASFLRPSPQTIRGHFPPPMHAASDAEMLWFGCGGCATELADDKHTADPASTSAASPQIQLPLMQRDDAFAANTWLQDWSRWAIRYTQSNSLKRSCRHGLLIDETLLNGEAIPESGSVRGAIQLWQACWADDSRWLTNSSLRDDRQSVNSLVHVRHANIDGNTAIVCINQAPWPMRVTLPIAELAKWSTTPPPPIESVRLIQPTVQSTVASIVVPASATSVCCCSSQISPTIQYAVEIEDVRSRVTTLTRQVTTIVENLGLLGELAGMTSVATSPAHTMVASNHHSTTRGVSASQSATANDVGSSSWASAFWSSDRWNVTRVITPSDNSTPPRGQTASSVSTAVDRLGDRTMTATQSSSQPTCRNLITNGGFEQPHEIGIPGWMHAHHPANAVIVDSLIYSEGANAIRMCGKDESGAASWMISREVNRPIAGRVGISMSIRGEAPSETDVTKASSKSSTNEPAEIRVAIEGERDGQPIRRSETIKFANDGKWRVGRLVMEWLDVDPQKDQNLRVTIDNFSTSAVWIDDVVVTDYFASTAERSELQSLAYLAVQGLQHSDLKPAALLLKNYWANDLLRIAEHTTVSMLTENEQDSANRTSSRSRFPFDVGTLPTPIWRDGAAPTTAIDSLAPRSTPAAPTTRSDSPLPESADSPRTTGNDARVKAEPDQSSKHTKAESEPSETIAGRIRRWLPTPLRF